MAPVSLVDPNISHAQTRRMVPLLENGRLADVLAEQIDQPALRRTLIRWVLPSTMPTPATYPSGKLPAKPPLSPGQNRIPDSIRWWRQILIRALLPKLDRFTVSAAMNLPDNA
jgi:hypothetical protein